MSTSTLADFQFMGRLGKGSFGEVHKVKRHEDGLIYVMKQINIVELSPQEQRDAINEVHIMARLDHPQVVRYYDSFIDAGILCIVMEYCDRGDLQRMMKKQAGHPLDEDRIWRLFIQTCLGLAYLHANRTLHRDLKTANIFMCSGDRVKIGDLGVARVLGTESYFAKTCCGTPYYLSPELVQGQPYNDKSDVWALGCVLYELCTGKHAFDARNQAALVVAILLGTYPPLPDTYSPGLRATCDSLLNRDSSLRPAVLDILASDVVYERASALAIELPPEVEARRELLRARSEAVSSAGTAGASAAGSASAAASGGAWTDASIATLAGVSRTGFVETISGSGPDAAARPLTADLLAAMRRGDTAARRDTAAATAVALAPPFDVAAVPVDTAAAAAAAGGGMFLTDFESPRGDLSPRPGHPTTVLAAAPTTSASAAAGVVPAATGARMLTSTVRIVDSSPSSGAAATVATPSSAFVDADAAALRVYERHFLGSTRPDAAAHVPSTGTSSVAGRGGVAAAGAAVVSDRRAAAAASVGAPFAAIRSPRSVADADRPITSTAAVRAPGGGLTSPTDSAARPASALVVPALAAKRVVPAAGVADSASPAAAAVVPVRNMRTRKGDPTAGARVARAPLPLPPKAQAAAAAAAARAAGESRIRSVSQQRRDGDDAPTAAVASVPGVARAGSEVVSPTQSPPTTARSVVAAGAAAAVGALGGLSSPTLRPPSAAVAAASHRPSSSGVVTGGAGAARMTIGLLHAVSKSLEGDSSKLAAASSATTLPSAHAPAAAPPPVVAVVDRAHHDTDAVDDGFEDGQYEDDFTDYDGSDEEARDSGAVEDDAVATSGVAVPVPQPAPAPAAPPAPPTLSPAMQAEVARLLDERDEVVGKCQWLRDRLSEHEASPPPSAAVAGASPRRGDDAAVSPPTSDGTSPGGGGVGAGAAGGGGRGGNLHYLMLYRYEYAVGRLREIDEALASLGLRPPPVEWDDADASGGADDSEFSS